MKIKTLMEELSRLDGEWDIYAVTQNLDTKEYLRIEPIEIIPTEHEEAVYLGGPGTRGESLVQEMAN